MPAFFLVQERDQVKAGDPRQLDIQHQHVDLHLLEGGEGRGRITDHRRAPAIDIVEQGFEEVGDAGIILNGKDGHV